MLKKTFAIMIAALIITSFAACNGAGSSDTGSASASATQT